MRKYIIAVLVPGSLSEINQKQTSQKVSLFYKYIQNKHHNVFRQQRQQYAISDSLLPLERSEIDLRLYILGNLVGGLGDTVGKTVGGVTNTVGGLVGGVGKTVGDTAGGLGNTVSGASEGLGNTTSSTGKSVGDTVSGASSSVGGQKQSAENPLGLSK
jgi:hypothetical protein